jgi:hypothetical protein
MTRTSTPTPTSTPVISISGTGLAFPATTRVGKTSKPKSLTLKNDGKKKTGAILKISGETVSSSAFAIKKSCKKSLKPGKNCKVSVTFKPPDTSPQTAVLTIVDDAGTGSQTVHCPERACRPSSALTFATLTAKTSPKSDARLGFEKCETVSIAGREVATTPVFYAYWRFAAERHQRMFAHLIDQNYPSRLRPMQADEVVVRVVAGGPTLSDSPASF